MRQPVRDRLRLLDPGRIRLWTALRTILAALAALLASAAVSDAAGLPGGIVVIATVVAVLVSRTLHETSLAHRLSALLYVPAIGLLAGYVGRFMLHHTWSGAATYVAAVGASRYLLRFGGRVRSLGRLALTPLIAVMVVPIPPSAAEAAGPVWGAVAAATAVCCVLLSQAVLPARPTAEAAAAALDLTRAARHLRALPPGTPRAARAAQALHRAALTTEDRLDAASLPPGAPLTTLSAAVLRAEVLALAAPEPPGLHPATPAHAPAPALGSPAAQVGAPAQGLPVLGGGASRPAVAQELPVLGGGASRPAVAQELPVAGGGDGGVARVLPVSGGGAPAQVLPVAGGGESGRAVGEAPPGAGDASPEQALPGAGDGAPGAAPEGQAVAAADGMPEGQAVAAAGGVPVGQGLSGGRGGAGGIAVAEDAFGAALAEVEAAAAAVRAVRARAHPVAEQPRPPARKGLQPHTRLSAQLTVAMAAAFAVGHLLFPRHWTWTVITAFVVCSAARARGDVVHRSGLRVAGAFTGAVTGTLVAHVAADAAPAAVAVIFCYLFVGLWLREVSYAVWAYCVTSLLAVLYSLNGEQGTAALLLQRPGGILAGSACGILAAYFVLPLRTETVMRGRAARALQILQDLLTAMREPHPEPAALRTAVRALDRASRDLGEAGASARAHRALFGRGAPHAADWADTLAVCVREARALAATPPQDLAAARPHLVLAARNVGQVRRRLGRRPDAEPPRAPASSSPLHLHRLNSALSDLYRQLPAPAHPAPAGAG